ncbi:MAG: bifunctional adenosylcobinamide kinase/adenosylcobinamide-phosphate guanylyltransferase [Nitrosomonas sp.]|uniref:bifunctional adenosylcobinamide kinase/adenosylcobinamide-phosphate guanylyltransferase n=1 Tax=Nitrosomonas sp. TaxID=42353 RepID=UPI001DA57FD5|nr:bifunctional adenosylcobinamide kinase/adenosylcobinamide-phosphate guanylyltransferase [Nitrosomonas sp.]MBX9893969.1 bifunctional adenosylcobinamide kinase/adenosylcobinamide-phosphate guanylyltransferase [Nitrosomonas sp.]
MTLMLILGGVKSGKSRLAERIAADSGFPVTYIATAAAGDDEMRERITRHRQHRPAHWQVIEEPLKLAAMLNRYAGYSSQCLLVDCLTLWLTNLLVHDDQSLLASERKALFDILPHVTGKLILVSNETNMGITPLGELSRRYCDEAGLLHQDLAAICDQVILTVAGLPLVLKGNPI